MGYNLTVQINRLDDSIIPQWVGEMNRFNTEVEIHPSFRFTDHTGFVPFKIIVHDCPNANLNDTAFMTGCEMHLSELERKSKKGAFIASLFGKKKQMKTGNVEVVFRISAQDSFEFRMGWYAAAALAYLCDGVLIDSQTGAQVEGQALFSHAQKTVLDDEKQIQEDEWRTHKFEGWST